MAGAVSTGRVTKVGPFWVQHHYYHIEGLTDLKPTRDQAEKRRTDRKSPEDSVIHFHKKEDGCEGKLHEIRIAGTAEVANITPS